MSQGWPEGKHGMSKWYVGCLDVSQGQVRSGEVRIRQLRTGQVQRGQVRAGYFRTEQVRTGQARKGQVRTCLFAPSLIVC